MPGFGDKLKSEREARHVTIEKIADETGIQRSYLEALETNSFGTLPGRSFGKLYIRSYARMLGIDPQPLIEEYDRELQRTRNPTPSPDAGQASSRPVGSMISSWRQAKIGERRRPATDVEEGDAAADAGEAEADAGKGVEVAAGEVEAAAGEIDATAGEVEAAPTDETAAQNVSVASGEGEAEEIAPPDESAAADTSVTSCGVVSEHESVEEEAHIEVGDARHADLEEAGRADVQEASRADVEEASEADVEELGQAKLEEASLADCEDAGHADVEPMGPAAYEEAAPDLASQSTPARRIRWRTPAVGVLALGLLVVLSVLAVLTIGQRRSGEPELAPADPAERSSPGAAASAAASGAASGAPGAAASTPSGAPAIAATPSPRNPVPDTPSSTALPPRPLPEPPTSRAEETRTAHGARSVENGGTSEGALSVTESALGRRIADHRVVDQDDRFVEGTEVWFQTRVLGGERGDGIRHVWIHDGRAVQSIRLPLGRSDWRTQSRKTIRQAGPWAVEARDEAGRVLARANFTCEPSSH